MHTLSFINYIIAILFTVCYAYQFLYIPVAFLLKKKATKAEPSLHEFAVMICARNEEVVIGDLINSLKAQTYPQNLIHIFVMADNCDDHTAEIAESCGAHVYTRFNKKLVGKGYALEELMNHLAIDYPDGFDGYFVFDADNLLEPDYIEQMNKTFSEGNDIITSYRNSKNYGSNWISSGYALWFLRESKYLNYPRNLLGTSCAVSGTGFMFGRRIADEIGAWPFHMLTEDIEFSVDQITKGEKIAFCKDAVLYDEQPVSFRQSWRQRMRWSRGYLQVFHGYKKDLLNGVFHGSFSCFDMSMTIMPAFILSILSIVCNITLGVWGAMIGDDIMIAVKSICQLLGNMYSMLGIIGVITTITERKKIRTSNIKKILYTLTFPLFMFTYIPISLVALFCKTEWKPIEHTVTAQQFDGIGRKQEERKSA